jgi:hypothetical protein
MSRWTEYTPSFDYVARKEGIPLPEAIALVGDAVKHGIENGSLAFNEAFSFSCEERWNRLGRPSYRVALPLAEALTRTDLDLKGSFLRFPHAAFALELPSSFVLRNQSGGRLSGLLVSGANDFVLAPGARGIRVEAPDGEGTWRFIVMQLWEGEFEPVSCILTLAPTDSVGEKLRAALNAKSHDASITDEKTTQQLVALAMGAALFAVGSNKFVRPVGTGLPSKRRGRRAGNRPPEPRRWTLGADIQLPRGGAVRSATDETSEPGEGRELQWAHIRQGHLRLTPSGPREDRSYVLRYIAPTVVRADLPLAPRATRHAMGPPVVGQVAPGELGEPPVSS